MTHSIDITIAQNIFRAIVEVGRPIRRRLFAIMLEKDDDSVN